MLEFLTANGGTLLIGALIAAAVVLILLKLRRDKRKGRSSCGCGCVNCPSAGMCHGGTEQPKKKGDQP